MTKQRKIKIRPDVAKLMARREPYYRKGLDEFIKIKEKEGINVKEELKKGNPKLNMELSRFQNDYFSKLEIAWRKIPADVKINRIDANGVPCEWIINPDVSDKGVILYLCSGGYIFGTLDTTRWNPYQLSRVTKCKAFNVGYRKAPENPYPAAIKDSITAYQWLISNDVNPREVIFAGASAGGALVVSTMLELRRMEIPLPSAGVLISPYADLAFTGESIISNQSASPGMTLEGLQGMAQTYLQGVDPKDPLASPVYANLEGLPPLLNQVGGIELFVDDAIRLAENAKQAGVEAKLEIWDDMPHVFQGFGNELPESKKALQNIAQFTAKILN